MGLIVYQGEKIDHGGFRFKTCGGRIDVPQVFH